MGTRSIESSVSKVTAVTASRNAKTSAVRDFESKKALNDSPGSCTGSPATQRGAEESDAHQSSRCRQHASQPKACRPESKYHSMLARWDTDSPHERIGTKDGSRLAIDRRLPSGVNRLVEYEESFVPGDDAYLDPVG